MTTWISWRGPRYRAVGRLVTKAFEVPKDFVEERLGLMRLEFEVVMRGVKTKHAVAHQRQRLDR